MLKKLIPLIFLSWIAYLLFWILGVVVVLVGWFMLKKRRKYLLLLSPLFIVPLMSFASGFWGYFDGSAKFRYVGLASMEFFNLDREYRVYKSTSGCLVDGGEFLENLPNNLILTFMIKNFGHIQGAYLGAYPNKEETQRLLKDIKLSSFSQVVQEYNLSKALVKTIVYDINRDSEESFELKAYWLKNECLILQKDNTLLIDIKKQKIFARYRLPLDLFPANYP